MHSQSYSSPPPTNMTFASWLLVVCIGQWRRAIFPRSLSWLCKIPHPTPCLLENKSTMHSGLGEPFLLLHMAVGVSLGSQVLRKRKLGIKTHMWSLFLALYNKSRVEGVTIYMLLLRKQMHCFWIHRASSTANCSSNKTCWHSLTTLLDKITFRIMVALLSITKLKCNGRRTSFILQWTDYS
jgi:hypothetical protein